jgi:sulfur carrier protein
MKKKIKIKIKIKLNGKVKIIEENSKLSNIIRKLRIPIKKVAIELNNEIMNKKNLNNINLKNNDKIEIVHFIGGG